MNDENMSTEYTEDGQIVESIMENAKTVILMAVDIRGILMVQNNTGNGRQAQAGEMQL
jgi:hypothetical protein